MLRVATLLALVGLGALPLGAAATTSDPHAVQIAEAVLARLGGREAWDQTHYVRWKFFGSRLHVWDKYSGDVRIEVPERRKEDGSVERPALLVLMNVNTKNGRVWAAGEPVTDEAKLREYLDLGHEIWINDMYWMFMPYKLLDPGATLRDRGERALPDGRPADVLEMTFAADVGYTPENKYEVFVARDTQLVEQWSFYEKATDTEPRFTLPWGGWKQFGRIWLATDHGQGKDWGIAVDADGVVRALFEP